MIFHKTKTEQKSPNRPIPANSPKFIKVQIHRTEFKGKEQWQATHRFYDTNKPSAYIDVVVNMNAWDAPWEADVWWVELIGMAPIARIVFANAVEIVHEGNTELPFHYAARACLESKQSESSDVLPDLDVSESQADTDDSYYDSDQYRDYYQEDVDENCERPDYRDYIEDDLY